MNVRLPLKKERKVSKTGGKWSVVSFKFERLGVFCFGCGHLGHTEQECEIMFSLENDDGTRGWGSELRVEQQRLGGGQGNRWLRDEKEALQNPNVHAMGTSGSHAEDHGSGHASVNAGDMRNNAGSRDQVVQFQNPLNAQPSVSRDLMAVTEPINLGAGISGSPHVP